MYHSEDNVIKFSINKYIFNDIVIEVLHKGEKSFKLLFVIQFNSFFMTSNYSIKFSRDQIDSIHKDIRYPTDFFVDLFFDNEKEEKLSLFDDYIIFWKSLLSEFISKSLKENAQINESKGKKINDADKLKDKKKIKDNSLKDDIEENLKIENICKINNKDEEILELSNTNLTLDQVNNFLKQIEGNRKDNNKFDNDEQEDEDIEKYLISLENQ